MKRTFVHKICSFNSNEKFIIY